MASPPAASPSCGGPPRMQGTPGDEWALLAGVWVGLALQLLRRLKKVTRDEHETEMAKLKLPWEVEASLREGKHCMLSPLADRSCLLVLAHLRRCCGHEPRSHFSAKAFFWAAISQVCVHDGAVLSFMMDKEAAASYSEAGWLDDFGSFKTQAAQWFDYAMADSGFSSSHHPPSRPATRAARCALWPRCSVSPTWARR
ncbi:unnamed protein product [Prorocentrum cordatum]|uniref:Uncharacterized protein n=1 Tax=Prorocentrum cordatum TaxID=2364126 RepID=A0ABN9V499_9DINO|nr:unnamed protein product [Polarella glacialis]